ncbi:hypothetical protein M885DRAFT_5886 [Pelagophyceae sp. CCMP2097]|nr:hypothetical protein M885DRAFT_5886 [Pelagophyceae sp. CCMP2097]
MSHAAPSARSDAAAERPLQRDRTEGPQRGRGEGPSIETGSRHRRKGRPSAVARSASATEGPPRGTLERDRSDELSRGGASRALGEGPSRATSWRDRPARPFRWAVSRGSSRGISHRNLLEGPCRKATSRDRLDRRLEGPCSRLEDLFRGAVECLSR